MKRLSTSSQKLLNRCSVFGPPCIYRAYQVYSM